MADAGAPPPPRSPLSLRSSTSILRRSASLFSSSPLPLLAAALLLLSFRTALLAGTLHLSSLADRDPSLRSLLHRLSDLPPSPSPVPRPPRRRPPLLHLSRAAAFFSDSPSDLTSPPSPLPLPNSSFPLFLLDPHLGFPKSRPHLPQFRLPHPHLGFAFPEENRDRDRDRIPDNPIDIKIFAGGHEIGRQDAFLILYILTLLSSTHTLAIIAFILSYTAALGIVFLSVTRSLLHAPVSSLSTISSGARLGFRRLTGSVFLRWAARDAAVQFLCICFFSEIQDQVKLFKLFVRVKLMPFSLTAPFPLGPWFAPLEADLSGFVYAWAVADMVSAVVLAVNPFVVIMDYNVRRRGPDAIKEGFYLSSLMLSQAIWIKLMETLVCGRVVRAVLMMIGGRMFAMAVQSVGEVYFMVAWLVFYFAVRSKDGELEGRRFGRRDLEDCINGLR